MPPVPPGPPKLKGRYEQLYGETQGFMSKHGMFLPRARRHMAEMKFPAYTTWPRGMYQLFETRYRAWVRNEELFRRVAHMLHLGVSDPPAPKIAVTLCRLASALAMHECLGDLP